MIKEHRLFIGILLLVSLLRLLPLFHYQFTLDELSGLNRTRFDSFSELIEKGVKIDAHPALIQVLIFYLVKCFGYTTWIIKLPFLLLSLAALFYAYVFALRNFSKQVAIFAVTVFSFSLVFVFYAPIARMYISGVFFSTALLYHFYEIFFQKNTRGTHFFMLGLFALLSALNQHINALFALTLCISGLAFLNAGNAKKYLLTCLLTVLAYLPHLPITLFQLGVGGIDLEQGGWLEKPDWTVVLDFLKVLFGTGSAFLILLVLVLFKNLADASTSLKMKHVFLLFIFLANYAVIYCYSVLKASVYQHSVMLFSGIAMVFFVCSLLDFTKPKLFYAALIIVGGTLIYLSYFKKDYYRQSVTTVFEYQFGRTSHYKSIYGEKNICPVFFDADEFMKQIYFKKYSDSFPCSISNDSACWNKSVFAKKLAGLQQNVLILSSPTPLDEALAMEYFPFRIENSITQSNNYRVYSRSGKDSAMTVSGEKLLFRSGIGSGDGIRYSIHSPVTASNTHSLIAVDSLTEFPLDAKCTYTSLFKKEGKYSC